MKSKRQHSEETKAKIRAKRNATIQKHSDMVVKCYELKINKKRLKKKQLNEIEMMFLEGKRLYNNILAKKKELEIPLNLINPTDFYSVEVLDKDKNKQTVELQFLPSHYKQTIHARMISNEKTIRSLIKRGYQTHGSLQFKSELTCIPLKSGDWKFKSENKIKLMGVSGKLLIRGLRQFNRDKVEFANANLLKKPDGYYLKITCYHNKKDLQFEKPNKTNIGLDFGIKTNITTSEGEKVNVSIEEGDQLKLLQKKLQRQKKGSNNRYKTLKRIRIAYQKQIQKKQDKANKFIHKMKQYERVIYQDEQLKNWHQDKRGGMSKTVQHSCMGLIKVKLGQLENSIKLDKFIPTTKFCPHCGSIKNDITLSDRTYDCHCGYSEDRDVHAAKNMIAIWQYLVENNLVPMDGREVKLEDWNSFQNDPRRCQVFSLA